MLFQSPLLLRTEIRLSNLLLLQSRCIEAFHMLSTTLYSTLELRCASSAAHCTPHGIVSSTCGVYARLGSACIPYNTILYDDCLESSTWHTDDSLTVLKLTKFLIILKVTRVVFSPFSTFHQTPISVILVGIIILESTNKFNPYSFELITKLY